MTDPERRLEQRFEQRLEQLAHSPVLLVASDYDGTLAPIVTEPAQARPLREAVVAMRTLAGLPHTHVAVISGRALRELAAMAGMPGEVHLVGSHGSEFDLDFATSLSPAEQARRERVIEELREIAGDGDGLSIEIKPASVAFHYRNAERDVARRALQAVRDGPGIIEGVVTRHGKEVVELGVVATNKGDALSIIRSRVGASAVIFLGDDHTDEDAFATLCGPDAGVKVGPGESRAAFRVADTADVARVLARLAELRANWLAGSTAVPIERHTLLSDLRTAALLTPAARIVWLCLPRIDSPAILAELLGGPAAGHFSVWPAAGGEPIEQHYVGDTMAVETRWHDLTVTDFLDCSHGRPSQRAGRSELVRILEGSGRAIVEFAPRFDFGRMPTLLSQREGGLSVDDALEPVVLRSPGVTWTIHDEGGHHTARAEIVLDAGPVTLELVHGSGSVRTAGDGAARRLEATRRWWSDWAGALELPAIATDAVRRSALLIRALVYGPTGAIAAAATTSLPETIGGVRNWDYRFCWLRDGALCAAALARLGSLGEAIRFLDWVLTVVDECESPEQLRPVYTVRGEVLGAEGEVGELPGYMGSRPVRVGNAAAHQVQLDVFGPIVDLIALLVERDGPVSGDHWRLVEAMVSAVRARWHEPDHGIWEIRKPRRHHVHSKVMCWLTIDRAIWLANSLHDRDMPDWRALRDEIATDILDRGWDANAGAFRAAYDGHDLDAAALHVGLSGLLPPDDPRFHATVDAVDRELSAGPVVYRYLADDGLPGSEGGFLLCTSWLIRCLIRLGRTDEAMQRFQRLLELAGPTGLMSEEFGANTRRALGNVPQGYSHSGVIEAAIDLDYVGAGRPTAPQGRKPADSAG